MKLKMKKKMIFGVAALYAATLTAGVAFDNPVEVPKSSESMIMPTKYSYNNSAKLFFYDRNDLGRIESIKIYDNEFRFEKSLLIPEYEELTSTYYIQYAKQGVVKYINPESHWEATYECYNETPEAFIKSNLGFEPKKITYDGKEVFVYPLPETGIKDDSKAINYYMEPDRFGDKYICQYYVEGVNVDSRQPRLEVYRVRYEKEFGYIGWEDEPRKYESRDTPRLATMMYYIEGGHSWPVVATQTLFNDDEDYEWILQNFTVMPTEWEDEREKAWGEEVVCTGLSVMSEKGTKIASIDLPAGYYIYGSAYPELYDLGHNRYLGIVAHCSSKNESYNLVYKIDSGNSTVKMIGEPIRSYVNPTAPKMGEPVNVELTEPATKGTMIKVVSQNGQTAINQRVEPGSTKAVIETSGLGQGVYVVVVSSETSSYESTKIIVR